MRVALTWAAVALAGGLTCPEILRADVFEFVALGDMPYTSAKYPDSEQKFDRLIAAINRLKPAFSIHVGDIKAGSTSCKDENLVRSLGRFMTFEHPLIYTPGDNEWTDCHRLQAGQFNSLERLNRVRTLFFANPDQSLGRMPMPVESQTRFVPNFAKYVENSRFQRDGVLFLTVHVVGSNNNRDLQVPEASAEYAERDQANVAWVEDSFRLASERNVKAVVIAMQAYTHDGVSVGSALPENSGYISIVDALQRGATSFKRPVLVIHGDAHRMELARYENSKGEPIEGVWRLEVMGEEHVHAIRVTVDTDDPSVFGFRPLIVPENGRY